MSRIAVLTTSFPRFEGDPSGHFVLAEVRELEAQGHAVTVLAPGGDAFGWPGLLARIEERPSRTLSAIAALARVRRALARTARAERVDRIVAHFLPTALLARRCGVPLEVVAHGTDVRVLGRLPPPLRTRVIDFVTREATVVRVVSAALRDELLAGAAPKARATLAAKIVVRPSPIEIGDVRKRSAELRAGAGTRRLAVTVARLVSSKGVDRVLHRVARDVSPTRLVIVGDGPERARLERMARALEVDAEFVGLVTRDEALAWIGAADVLFHASLAEGASTVIREAEALGTRVEAW